MNRDLWLRTFVIGVVLLFLGWKAYDGIFAKQLQLGIDLQGGSELIFKFAFANTPDKNKPQLLAQATKIIEERINGYGLKDISLEPIGNDRFAVQVSAKEKTNVDAIKDLIQVLGKLEFRITVEPKADTFDYYWKKFQDDLAAGKPEAVAASITPDERASSDKAKNLYPYGLKWYRLSEKATHRYSPSRLPKDKNGAPQPWVLVRLDKDNISGEDLQNVNYGLSQQPGTSGYIVTFQVKKLRQRAMGDLTGGDHEDMAIILNNRVDSAPVLNSELTASGQIEGNFSQDEAKSLAAVLQAGALQEKPALVSESTIAPDLAGHARWIGILSTMVGFGVVLLIMVFLYYGPGLIANLALLLNLLILVGVLNWFGAVLTLPGIAGVVLTVGMAVDANILVFERIKEERARGRTVAQAVAAGYDRALVTIIDSNLTTLITAYFLFQIGSGPVRGFGITLAIGIISSMFTALYVTRTVFLYLMNKGWMTKVKMRGEFAPPTFPWMKWSRPAVLTSVIAVLAGLVLYFVTPEKVKYDLDFTKGSQLIVRFHETVPAKTVEDKLAALAAKNPIYKDIAVRTAAAGIGRKVQTGEGQTYQLRSQDIATREEIDTFVAKLRQAFSKELMPGPFEDTLHTVAGSPQKTTGTLTFLRGDVKAAILREAFRQYAVKHPGKLAEPEVQQVPPPPGAGSAVRVTVSQPLVDASAIVLDVRQALAGYDPAKAVTDLQDRSTNVSLPKSEQKQAKEDLAVVSKYKTIPDGFFSETDPFPLADRVDPYTAREHRDAAVDAIAFSILGIIVYVAFRFRSWAYGFASVIALIHDVSVILGVVALASWLGIAECRLNLVTVAAFLTLIGYSINDTIVVFDRIRENRGTTGRARLGEIIDQSVNQTLSRSIRTSLTTWTVVFILLLMNYGVNAPLEGFAFILTAGIIVGTYSSVFIASPTLIFLPWMWRRCNSSTKTFVVRVLYVAAICAVGLLAIDYFEGNLNFSQDCSVTIFNDLVISIPVGLMLLFCWYLLSWVRLEKPEASPEPATT